MRIGILTHPLGHNYGGILQAYALKSELEHKGHQAILIDRREEEPKYKLVIKRILRVLRIPKFYSYYKTNKQLLSFVRKNFKHIYNSWDSCPYQRLSIFERGNQNGHRKSRDY